MSSLSHKEIKELVIKCWMTHDGMWFLHCLRKTGIKTTNKINKAASHGLGLIEAKRFKKVFGIEKINTFTGLKNFINKIFEIVKADFMKFSYNFSKHNTFHFEMLQCFAHDGRKRIGVIDEYKCGIYDRIDGWFEGLGLKFSISPKIEGCLMHKGQRCIRKYVFKFPELTAKH
ncbi:MAG: DUF6125 family protein [Promethearchaeota archaeon]